MPTHARREDELIRLFLSAYRGGDWKDCRVEWLDRVADRSVEALAPEIRWADSRSNTRSLSRSSATVGTSRDLRRFSRLKQIGHCFMTDGLPTSMFRGTPSALAVR